MAHGVTAAGIVAMAGKARRDFARAVAGKRGRAVGVSFVLAALFALAAVVAAAVPDLSPVSGGAVAAAAPAPPVSPFAVAAAVLSVLALAALGGGLALGDARPLPWSIALLGVAWLVAIWPHGDGRSALTAGAGAWLFVVAELAYWSLDFRVAAADDAAVLRRRLARIVALAVAGALLGAIPLVPVSLAPLSGEALTVFGAAAIAVVLAVIGRLASPAGRGGGGGLA